MHYWEIEHSTKGKGVWVYSLISSLVSATNYNAGRPRNKTKSWSRGHVFFSV